MKNIKRIPDLLLLIIFFSIIPFWTETSLGTGLKLLVTILLSLLYIYELFGGGREKSPSKRLKRIDRGAGRIWLGGISAFAEIFVIIWYFNKTDSGAAAKTFSIVMPVLTIALLIISGLIAVSVGSKQIKPKDHILLLLFWWVPVVNIFMIRSFYKTARREYYFESAKEEIENARVENEICSTKYPILMVHGIFFRDWQLMNYWGRIPATLIRNGAKVYYGRQQSAQSVADSAAELKDTILKIIEETGAEKVNIIAHSKGGLDSRYAVSCLGMDKYVATITTINTPHNGCDMVDYLLKKVPQGMVDFLEKRYNKLFTVLGDTKPNFLAGVYDLSAVNAAALNEKMPDSPEVSYRSYMSVMSCAGSAGFPLNIGYLLIKKLNGANDGLVWEGSAAHGKFTLVKSPHKRGISHGDVIDLFRENIEGYDVREFYADIVKQLKNEGY